MNRLTHGECGAYALKACDECQSECRGIHDVGKCMMQAVRKLHAYEDTGYTPEEIALFVKCNAMQVSKRELQLKMENERLKVELDALKARVDAVEKAIPHTCHTCVGCEVEDDTSGNCKGWVFSEERGTCMSGADMGREGA